VRYGRGAIASSYDRKIAGSTLASVAPICASQGCARDRLSRDRNETLKIRDETRDKTLQLPRRWPRPCSSRDSRESRELQRLAETFSVTYGETH